MLTDSMRELLFLLFSNPTFLDISNEILSGPLVPKFKDENWRVAFGPDSSMTVMLFTLFTTCCPSFVGEVGNSGRFRRWIFYSSFEGVDD